MSPIGSAKIRAVRGAARLVHGSYTLGAAVAVLNDGDVLLVRDIHRSSEWALPGGFLHRRGKVKRSRESPEQAAKREVKEETGLEINLDELEPVLHFDHKHPHLHFLWSLPYSKSAMGTVERGSLEVLETCWDRVNSLTRPIAEGTRRQLTCLGLLEPTSD